MSSPGASPQLLSFLLLSESQDQIVPKYLKGLLLFYKSLKIGLSKLGKKLALCTDKAPRTLVECGSTIGCMYTTVSS